MPKLFIALELPTPIKQQLIGLARPMRGAKWQTMAQMHLTLNFIGEVDKSRIADLVTQLSEINAPSLALQVNSVDYAGSKRFPRVLFAKVESHPHLLKLQKQITRALATLDIPIEKKKYQPHITLARLNQTPYSAIAEFIQTQSLLKTDVFTIDSFQLFSSKLKLTGSEYTIEANFLLH